METYTHVHEQPFPLDDLFREFLPDEKLKSAMVCSDMDQTMFDKDIGLLVFLEKLATPHFWNNIPKHLVAHILIPLRYRRILQEGARGTKVSKKVLNCRYALALERDILDLWQRINKLVPAGEHLDLNHPTINEFAGKMIMLDRVIMGLQPYFLTKIQRDELFMRTRFFAGRNKGMVVRYTNRVMARSPDDPHRHVTLRVHEKEEFHRKKTFRAVGIRRIEQDRLVKVVEGVREILHRCFEKGAAIQVVTTNLTDIAQEAIRESAYNFLDPRDAVIGGRLFRRKRSRGKPYRYDTRMDAPPIFAQRKAEVASYMSRVRKRVFLVALGDSPSNDSPMGELALKNGGVFVMVGKTIHETREKFKPLFEKLSGEGLPDVGRRMWYVEI